MAPTKNPHRRPNVKTAVKARQHPLLGNGHAYSHDFRLFVQYCRHHNLHLNPIIREAQRQHIFPSPPTVCRHHNRQITLGHLRHFRKQGNNRATVLCGVDLYNLALWRTVA